MNGSALDLRPGRLRDAAEMARLTLEEVEAGLPLRTWTQARVLQWLRQPETASVVAARAGRLAGFALMDFGEDSAHLVLLAVRPDCRRAGVGRRLLGWLEDSALTAGAGRIFLELREGNLAGAAFYRALGYREFERVPRYYCARETAVRMARDLHPVEALCRRPFD